MSQDFEDRLRAALRPEDPGEDFTQRVISRATAQPKRPARWAWLGTALAASIAAGVIVVHERQAQRERQGAEARRQLIEALQVAGGKLDLAYQAVRDEPRSAAGKNAGA